MSDPIWMQSTATEFILAALIGLLVGWTREKGDNDHRAGLRDFVLIAVTGGIAAVGGQVWLAATLLAAVTAALVILRMMAPVRWAAPPICEWNI